MANVLKLEKAGRDRFSSGRREQHPGDGAHDQRLKEHGDQAGLRDLRLDVRGLPDTTRSATCPAKSIQVDEIWSFVYAKAKNVPQERRGQFGFGDVWTFTAIDADSKLCVSWSIGARDTETATEFMQDVAARLSNRVQISTDGHRMYLTSRGGRLRGER